MENEQVEEGDMVCFGRGELQSIRYRALTMAATSGLNRGWRRVYFALADAANTLDAFIARTEDCAEEK
jgi:hypothetical protein